MTRVYTQTATSHMVPLECSPTQFEGINAGMLFLGWVFPATRNNPFVRSDSLNSGYSTERRPSLSSAGSGGVQRYTGVPSANAVKVMTVPSPSPTSSVTSSRAYGRYA